MPQDASGRRQRLKRGRKVLAWRVEEEDPPDWKEEIELDECPWSEGDYEGLRGLMEQVRREKRPKEPPKWLVLLAAMFLAFVLLLVNRSLDVLVGAADPAQMAEAMGVTFQGLGELLKIVFGGSIVVGAARLWRAWRGRLK